MNDCCRKCGKCMHIVVSNATRNPFKDAWLLMHGLGEILAFECREEPSRESACSLLYRHGTDSCDFCRMPDGSWRYFFRSLDEGIPKSAWTALDNFAEWKVSDGDSFDTGSCMYYDAMLVDGICSKEEVELE